MVSKSILLLTLISLALCTKTPESDYYSNDPNRYLYVENIACDSETNCKEPNYCSADKTTCYCNKGLANYPFGGYKGQYCYYEQHKQLTSFLWELLTNIGVGHFIIGNNLIGTFKLIFMVIPITIQILGCVRIVKVGFGTGTTGTTMQVISLVFGAGAFIWWLADAILFGTNKHRDCYDVPLAKW